MISEKSQRTQNGTMFVDLAWPLNAARRLSASAELLLHYSYLTPSTDSLIGSVKRTGEEFAIFHWNHRLSRKQYEIGTLLLRNFNRKSLVADRAASVPMTLSDLERRDVGFIFQVDLLNNARTVWTRTTKFGRITHSHVKEGAYF